MGKMNPPKSGSSVHKDMGLKQSTGSAYLQLNRMTEYDQELFASIYEWLYALVQHTHKGCMVDQAAVMDGAIRLMDVTLRKERRRE